MNTEKPTHLLSQKRFVLLIGVVLVIGIGYLVLDDDDAVATTSQTATVENVEGQGQQPVNNSSAPVKAPSPSAVKQRTAADVAIVDSWFDEVGYSTELRKTYDQQYSDEQLKDLADTGDIIAIDTLLERIFRKNNLEFEAKLKALIDAGDYVGIQQLGTIDKEYIALAEKGIVYGSYNAISALARSVGQVPSPDDSPEQKQQNIQSLREQLAFMGVMKMRGGGELYSTDILKEHMLNWYRKDYGEEPLSAEDHEWINNRTHELYNHYQAKRHELGLGDFDNEPPKEVKEFLGE